MMATSSPKTDSLLSWRRSIKTIIAPVAFTVAGGALLYFWIVPGPCAPELMISGRKISFTAAVNRLNIGGEASPAAQEVIKERLQFFLERSARLCRDEREKRITKEQYESKQEELARWFMGIEQMVASGQLKTTDSDSREATAAALQTLPAAQPAALAQIQLKNSDGAALPDGASVHRGEKLALFVDVSNEKYLYVVDVGTDGIVRRIFPSKNLSPKTNPVSGELRIPAENDRYLEVGGPLGTEKIYVFVQDVEDTQIGSLPGLEGTSNVDTIRTLDHVIAIRNLFAEPRPHAPEAPTGSQRDETVSLASRYGKAMATFALHYAN